jgi:tRNA-specific 2-thiouridylase
VGAHAGVHRYTVGQRKGIGAADRPRYVVEIEPRSNRIVIGGEEALLRTRFRVRDANWIAVPSLDEPIRCEIQIRNRFEPQPGTVAMEDGRATVTFDTPQRAVTPGQAAVFYWDDVVVGGGWIEPGTCG